MFPLRSSEMFVIFPPILSQNATKNMPQGVLAIHDFIVEEDLVHYWQQFGAIAFDTKHKAMLTVCSLKSPDHQPGDPEIPCCFSFTVVRDTHNM